MLDAFIRESTEDVRPGGGTEHNPIFMALPHAQGTNCILLWNLENTCTVSVQH